MNTRICDICGEPFEPKTKRSRVCYSEECRRVNQCNIQKKNYMLNKNRECVICGNTFRPTREWQVVCSNPKCKKERNLQNVRRTNLRNQARRQEELELDDRDIPEPVFPLPRAWITKESVIKLATVVCINAAQEKDWEWFYTESGEWWMDMAGIDPDSIKDKMDVIIGVKGNLQ